MKNKELAAFFALTFILLLLGGCRYSDRYLIHHPDTFKGVLTACQSMGSAAHTDQTCQQAQMLYRKLYQYSLSLTHDPEQFGITVLHDQMKLADLSEKIATLQQQSQKAQASKELKIAQEQYLLLKQRLTVKLGLISQMEGI